MSGLAISIGIDVACGRKRPLPLCVASIEAGRLTPIAMPQALTAGLPRGLGNTEVCSEQPFRAAAEQVAQALRNIVNVHGWSVVGIAIDAPAAPPISGRRLAEAQLSARRLSSFATPTLDAWMEIRAKCTRYLAEGGMASSIPYANMIWMLYGFELFRSLRAHFGEAVFETYPYAIVREMLPVGRHKSTAEGYQEQLRAVGSHIGWDPIELERRLKAAVPGKSHDRLDAFMAAWVASIPPSKRRVFGDPASPDDSIWVPSLN